MVGQNNLTSRSQSFGGGHARKFTGESKSWIFAEITQRLGLTLWDDRKIRL